jgi:hypothetical protein
LPRETGKARAISFALTPSCNDSRNISRIVYIGSLPLGIGSSSLRDSIGEGSNVFVQASLSAQAHIRFLIDRLENTVGKRPFWMRIAGQIKREYPAILRENGWPFSMRIAGHFRREYAVNNRRVAG